MGDACAKQQKGCPFFSLIIFLAKAEGQPASAATLIRCTFKNFLSLSDWYFAGHP